MGSHRSSVVELEHEENSITSAAHREEMIKYVALAINLLLVLCKIVALAVCAKHAITQSLLDSVGDVLGNIAVIVFREEVGVLLQAIVMGLMSVGVIVPSACSLLALPGVLADQSSGNDESERLTAVILILVAILTKGLVYVICGMLARRRNAGIAVQAIREDAANDVMMNTGALLCAFPEFWLALFHGRMPKTLMTYLVSGMDPAWTFAMSLPILHGWIVTAQAQIATLQNESSAAQVKDEQPECMAITSCQSSESKASQQAEKTLPGLLTSRSCETALSSLQFQFNPKAPAFEPAPSPVQFQFDPKAPAFDPAPSPVQFQLDPKAPAFEPRRVAVLQKIPAPRAPVLKGSRSTTHTGLITLRSPVQKPRATHDLMHTSSQPKEPTAAVLAGCGEHVSHQLVQREIPTSTEIRDQRSEEQ